MSIDSIENRLLKLKPQSKPEDQLSIEEQSKIPNSFLQRLFKEQSIFNILWQNSVKRNLLYFRRLTLKKAFLKAKAKNKQKRAARRAEMISKIYDFWTTLLRDIDLSIRDYFKNLREHLDTLMHSLSHLIPKLIKLLTNPIIHALKLVQPYVEKMKIYFSDLLKLTPTMSQNFHLNDVITNPNSSETPVLKFNYINEAELLSKLDPDMLRMNFSQLALTAPASKLMKGSCLPVDADALLQKQQQLTILFDGQKADMAQKTRYISTVPRERPHRPQFRNI